LPELNLLLRDIMGRAAIAMVGRVVVDRGPPFLSSQHNRAAARSFAVLFPSSVLHS